MIVECPKCKHEFEIGKRKNFALNLIQVSWVFEVYALLAFTMILIMWFPDKFDMLVAAYPHFVLLIGGQGAIAGGGPLVSQALDKKDREDKL